MFLTISSCKCTHFFRTAPLKLQNGAQILLSHNVETIFKLSNFATGHYLGTLEHLKHTQKTEPIYI